MLYPVAIFQQDNLFRAKIPDLPELTAIEGNSMADTITQVRHIIINHLQRLSDNDEPIPVGQELNIHLQNPEFLGHTWAIISLDSLRFVTRTLPINLNIPKALVNQMHTQLIKEQKISPEHEIEAHELEDFMLKALKFYLKSHQNS